MTAQPQRPNIFGRAYDSLKWVGRAQRRAQAKARTLETYRQYLAVTVWGWFFKTATTLGVVACLVLAALIYSQSVTSTAQAFVTFDDYIRPRPPALVQWMHHNPRHAYTAADLAAWPLDWAAMLLPGTRDLLIWQLERAWECDRPSFMTGPTVYPPCRAPNRIVEGWDELLRSWQWYDTTTPDQQKYARWLENLAGATLLCLLMAIWIHFDLRGWHDREARAIRDMSRQDSK